MRHLLTNNQNQNIMLSHFIKLPFLVWVCVISMVTFSVGAQPNYPTDPNQAQLISVDLEHFVEAMKAFSSDKDSIQVLNKYYFDKASAGLTEYIGRHQLTPELLLEAINTHPEIYSQIESYIDTLPALQKAYQKHLGKFQEVLPKAMYAPTYLLVGAHRGIAQASLYGQLVTITRTLDDPDKLMKLIIHELSHFQQAMTMGGEKYVNLYREPNNMLGLCLREGGAEFITSLVLNDITQTKSLKYLEENEVELRKKFQADLSNQDTSFWLWESINQKEYPILMGYAMGYKICESLYAIHANKEQALQKILLMNNPSEFLEESRYFE